MTGRGRRCSGLSRRRLLSAAATGLVGGLAGCGYRPGGGDLAWESSLDIGGLVGTGTTWFAATSDRLFAVRNQSGRTYDFDTSTWRDIENASVTAVDATGTTRFDAATERQAVASPVVAGASVFVPVEGGRVTAIDRDAAGFDPDARGTTGGTESDGAGGDEIRWQTDEPAPDGDGPRESDETPGIDGIRASDRLVVAVGGAELVALDAETGDRAFGVTEAWTGLDDVGLGAGAARVAVDGEDVWVAINGTESDAGSGEVSSVVVRFGPSGERRTERPIPDGADWLVVVDGTAVLGHADRGSVTGYDRDLHRRFTLAVPTPADAPPVVEADGSDTASRVYLSRGGTVRAVDVAAGAVAWERSDVPVHRGFAVDADGIYAVGSRSRGQSIVAVGVDGADRWTAPLPADVTVDELFAVGDRLIVVDGDDLYGLHAAPGERWSLLG